ncbi:MAG TPA: peptidoglycan DD-metalloendopeptidase family protein [Methylotenera sp.]|nr:peptidoglycan DD-metalloendopeptidase family protein [Methylotenera sp.]
MLSFVACSSNPPAPVIDRLPANKSSTTNKSGKSTATRPVYKAGDWRPDTYIVKKGDTLFSIGLEHGYDYKEIAEANGIAAPYTIKVGQSLKFSTLKDKPVTADNQPVTSTVNSDGVVITPINAEANVSGASATSTTPTVVAINEPKAISEPYSEEALKRPLPTTKATVNPATAKPVTSTTAVAAKPTTDKSTTEIMPDNKTAETKSVESKSDSGSPEDIDWAWPTKGKVIANFNEASNKGIDIAGSTGQAINAAAAGKVIYSGSDLRGYGKLVIVKHNKTYLSVYAHNSLILVKEGQQVSRGQKIAEMGNTDSNAVKLHFEIRRQGKSVDPDKYLAAN